ncbi:MAG: LysM peptidoglycan-binding domain-containing protein, partial [Actinomycetota bacterium]
VPVAPLIHEAPREVLEAAAPILAYRVRPGDSLWSIAGTHLGDASRWREIWRSNAGRLMGDGARFVDPNLIQPGWSLRLPER